MRGRGKDGEEVKAAIKSGVAKVVLMQLGGRGSGGGLGRAGTGKKKTRSRCSYEVRRCEGGLDAGEVDRPVGEGRGKKEKQWAGDGGVGANWGGQVEAAAVAKAVWT